MKQLCSNFKGKRKIDKFSKDEDVKSAQEEVNAALDAWVMTEAELIDAHNVSNTT